MMSGRGSSPRRMIPGHASPGRPAPNLNALTLPPFRYLPEAARCFGIRLLPSLNLSVVLDLSKPGRLPNGPWVNANNRYDGQLRFVTCEAQ